MSTQNPDGYQPAPQPGYAPPPAYAPYPGQKAGTNVLAIIALIGAFVFPLAGVICGHIALSQIKRTGESGRGLAIAGLVVGYIYIAFIVLIVLLAVVGGIIAAANGSSYSY